MAIQVIFNPPPLFVCLFVLMMCFYTLQQYCLNLNAIFLLHYLEFYIVAKDRLKYRFMEAAQPLAITRPEFPCPLVTQNNQHLNRVRFTIPSLQHSTIITRDGNKL